MTTITPTEAFKSKKNFEEFMADQHPAVITTTLADYPKADGKNIVTFAELTQSIETLTNTVGSDLVKNLPKPPFIVWIVANERENILNALDVINKNTIKDFGIFVFKAFLNEDKIDFKCLLKPELRKANNSNTPAKKMQLEYWEKYFEICDEVQSEMQVSPESQHWQYLPIGKRGVSIMLSVSSVKKYVGVDLVINYDKSIFEKLYANKDEIEKELGELEWVNIQKNKSCKVRQTINADLDNREMWKDTILKHIQIAEKFKSIFSKYL